MNKIIPNYFLNIPAIHRFDRFRFRSAFCATTITMQNVICYFEPNGLRILYENFNRFASHHKSHKAIILSNNNNNHF